MSLQELSDTQEGAAKESAGSIPSEDLNITAPGKLRVIKRNGKVVSFEEDKIKIAVTKAFLANESGNAAASERIHRKVEDISKDVQDTFKRRMPSGGTLTHRRNPRPGRTPAYAQRGIRCRKEIHTSIQRRKGL